MAKIAHTQNDVKKRRATFEERWKAFQGNMYDEEQIRKAVFAPIKISSFNTYFCDQRNPLFGFENGVFSYTEEPFRQALWHCRVCGRWNPIRCGPGSRRNPRS